MSAEFALTQKRLDRLTDQLTEVRAEALATRVAAGVAIAMLIAGAQNRTEVLNAFRAQGRKSLKAITFPSGEGASTAKTLEKARVDFEQFCDGLAGDAQS